MFQTVQHPPDRHLVHILVVRRSRTHKPTQPLRRRLILQVYIPTVSRLCLHRLKAPPSGCSLIHPSRRLCRRLRRQPLRVLEATHLLERLPGQLPTLVVHPLVLRAIAETTGTLWRPSTIPFSKRVRDKALEVGEEIVCQTGLRCHTRVHRHRLLAWAKVPDLKCRCHHRKINPVPIYFLAVTTRT